jgi:hypothetical protein
MGFARTLYARKYSGHRDQNLGKVNKQIANTPHLFWLSGSLCAEILLLMHLCVKWANDFEIMLFFCMNKIDVHEKNAENEKAHLIVYRHDIAGTVWQRPGCCLDIL